MHLKNIFLLATFLLLVTAISGCTAESTKAVKDPLTEAGPSLDTKMQQFITRHLDESVDLSDREKSDIASVKNIPAQSLTEAYVALGLVKLAIKLAGSSETDKQKASLEALMLERSIDLPRVIQNNPHVGGLAFYKLSLVALKLTNNSSLFVQSVNSSVAEKLGSQPSSVATDTVTPAGDSNDWARIEMNAADVRLADYYLIAAQKLADEKKFEEALAVIEQVPTDSPVFGLAQEKLSELSDMAVQNLRQKAAIEYQSAMPQQDPKTKAEYLGRARQHLQKAIETFPLATAEQIGTIKDNLSVIDAELQRIGDKNTTL